MRQAPDLWGEHESCRPRGRSAVGGPHLNAASTPNRLWHSLYPLRHGVSWMLK